MKTKEAETYLGYETYQLKGADRIKGPGVDAYYGHFNTPHGMANLLAVAYRAGYRAAKKPKRGKMK